MAGWPVMSSDDGAARTSRIVARCVAWTALAGVLSGSSPWLRALRQLAIGWGAAAVTYLLGLAFGASVA